MAALGWLLNLGFAGGTEAAVGTISATWTPKARATTWTPETRATTWTPEARSATWTPSADRRND